MRQRPNETSWTSRISSADFEAFFEELHDPAVEFLFTNGEPIVIQANDAFCDVFCPGDSISNPWLDEVITPVDGSETAEEISEHLGTGESTQEIVERMTPDGPRTFIHRGVPITEDRGFAIYTEITERVRQKEHLNILHRVLRHNLRNDTNIITSAAREALRNAEDDNAREHLTTVIETSNSLSRLCSEASTIRKVLNNEFSKHPVGFVSIVESVVSTCLERFDQAQISLDSNGEMIVMADGHLEVLVDNLVDNAIRHNTSELSRVNISTRSTGDMAELVVSDNGPGIPEVEQKIVTEEINISSLEHGSGLGLWLSKWLVQSYGGRIQIDSNNSCGSMVTVKIPLAD